MNDGSEQLELPYPFPAETNSYLAGHVQLLCDSLHALTGRDLVEPRLTPAARAKQIFHAPFIVLSHNNDPDPVLTYANMAGLKLFEMDWNMLVMTRSRYTAEAPVREERENLLRQVSEHGFIDDYAGVRVSATGRRFRIEQATVWNLSDLSGNCRGQAATFSRWTRL